MLYDVNTTRKLEEKIISQPTVIDVSPKTIHQVEALSDIDLIEAINTGPFKYKIKWKSFMSKFKSIFSNNFAYSEKYDINKYLLRKVSKKYLPHNISTRKKSGFPLPMNNWMKNDVIKDILFDQTTSSRKLYDMKFVHNLFRKRDNNDIYDFNGKKIWMILNLELWMREFFD